MYNLFYITEVRPQWYNLILKDTHFCVACGSDLSVMEKTIYSYVRKYKTADRVYRAMTKLEGGDRVSPATYDKRSNDYKSGKHLVFNDFVTGIVTRAIKDNRHDTPYHHTKKKVKSLVPHTTVTHIAASHVPPLNKEVRVGKKITPLKIKKTTT